MLRILATLFLSVLAMAQVACSPADPTGSDAGSDGQDGARDGTDGGDSGPDCLLDDDCASGQVCTEGVCVEAGCPADDRCEWGGSCCPDGFECVERSCMLLCEGVRCGRALAQCCAAGQVCEEGRCMIDCQGQSRCGRQLQTCCASEEICYGFLCSSTTGACTKQTDCPEGHVCEPDLAICIPEEAVGDCLYHPPSGSFMPYVDCRWVPGASDVQPEFDDVVMAPVVANLTDDDGDGLTTLSDTPDLVFVSYDLEGAEDRERTGILRVVSGACLPSGGMTTIASLAQPALDHAGGLALGDLDGDGVPEIVAMTRLNDRSQGTVAFRRTSPDGSTWEVMWHNPSYPVWGTHTRGAAQPALADLDADGSPEVIVGNLALDGTDGSLLWDGVVTSGGWGGIGHNVALGPVSTVADIDLDGLPEVLAGNTCYRSDGEVAWTFAFPGQNSQCANPLACDGYTGVGDFDDDPQAEVVIVRLGEVYVLEDDGQMLARIPIPAIECPANEGGPPTVADFDGDGRPEIGLAAADYYVVADLDCLAEPLPAGCDSSGILWKARNQDCSSRVTASSVFDFEGDGRAEVIYADEATLRIFDGSDGTPLMVDQTHGSHTLLEMAVIADVDNDGNAEIVIAENATFGGTPGVEVWADRQDNWVATRRIWNQHSYHVTNVSETGSVPAYESPNWQNDHLNNFRQNTQGLGLFWAPDLVVVQPVANCEFGRSVTFTFEVVNQGSRMVAPGVPVTLYVDGQAIATLQTSRTLLPGHLEPFSYTWILPPGQAGVSFGFQVAADDLGDGTGLHNECEDAGEDNNQAVIETVFCDIEH